MDNIKHKSNDTKHGNILNETNYMIFSYSNDWNLTLNFKCQTKFTGKILNSLSGKVPQ